MKKSDHLKIASEYLLKYFQLQTRPVNLHKIAGDLGMGGYFDFYETIFMEALTFLEIKEGKIKCYWSGRKSELCTYSLVKDNE